MPDECDHHWIPERDENDRVTGEVVCPKCEAVLSQLIEPQIVALATSSFSAAKRDTGHTTLTVSGIGRDEHAPHGAALVLYLNRCPTDDEMRAILEGMRDLVNGG